MCDDMHGRNVDMWFSSSFLRLYIVWTVPVRQDSVLTAQHSLFAWETDGLSFQSSSANVKVYVFGTSK